MSWYLNESNIKLNIAKRKIISSLLLNNYDLISICFCKLYTAGAHNKSWLYTGLEGGLTLVIDYRRKTARFLLFDLNTLEIVFENEFYRKFNIFYNNLSENFQCFEVSGGFIGFNIPDKYDADKFFKAVTGLTDQTIARKVKDIKINNILDIKTNAKKMLTLLQEKLGEEYFFKENLDYENSLEFDYNHLEKIFESIEYDSKTKSFSITGNDEEIKKLVMNIEGIKIKDEKDQRIADPKAFIAELYRNFQATEKIIKKTQKDDSSKNHQKGNLVKPIDNSKTNVKASFLKEIPNKENEVLSENGIDNQINKQVNSVTNRILPEKKIENKKQDIKQEAINVSSITTIPKPAIVQNIPNVPSVNTVPKVQNIPNVPSVNNVPKNQNIPNVPSVNTIPKVQNIPNVPSVNTVPKVSNVPSVPTIPKVPTVPNVPNVPHVPNVPSIPSIPKMPPPNNALLMAIQQAGENKKAILKKPPVINDRSAPKIDRADLNDSQKNENTNNNLNQIALENNPPVKKPMDMRSELRMKMENRMKKQENISADINKPNDNSNNLISRNDFNSLPLNNKPVNSSNEVLKNNLNSNNFLNKEAPNTENNFNKEKEETLNKNQNSMKIDNSENPGNYY